MNAKSRLYSELKTRAIKLRRQGMTFSEINDKLGHIPKGTLSGWLKNVELTNEQNERIKQIMFNKGLAGRQIGAQKNHQNRLDRLTTIKTTAELEFDKYFADPSFLAGLILYLAEGSKKAEQFQFMNSDPKLVLYMMRWIIKFGNKNTNELYFRLYIHELYAHENCENFWVKALNIKENQLLKTIYKPTGRMYKKNAGYKGCMRLEIRGNELYWKIIYWRDCFYATL